MAPPSLIDDGQIKSGKKCILCCFGWVVWFGLIILFGQNTWASIYENEPRAAMIYAAITGLLFLGGGIVYYSRRMQE